jgi:hypothetical protein
MYRKNSNKYFDSSIVEGNISILMEKVSFLEKTEYKKDLQNVLFPLLEKSNQWKKCINSCEKILSYWIERETKTTAFFLRVLCNSVLGNKKNIKIICDTFTGNLETDIHTIKIIMKKDKKCKDRLVFGFGPSASGKTFLVTKVLDLFRKNVPHFPKTFLVIDGGVIRESSVVYKTIVNIIQDHFKVGISNLSQPTIYSVIHLEKILFPQKKIKKNIVFCLSKQETRFSLFVPETLSYCGSTLRSKGRDVSCNKLVQKYNKIVKDDEWIGIMIYQHKNKTSCSFSKEYSCEGCLESGKKREMMEGKKYSNVSWNHSFQIGMKMMKEAPGYSLLIHNSGSKDRPCLVTDFSQNPIIYRDIYKNKKIFMKYLSKN